MSHEQVSKDSFIVTRTLLKIGGISLEPERDKLSFKIYSRLIMLANLFGFLQFLGVPKYLQTDKDVFEFILFEVILVIILLKFVVAYYNRVSLGTVLKKLQALLRPDYERGGLPEKLVEEYNQRTKRQSLVYWSIAVLTSTSALLDSIWSRLSSKELIWKYEYGPFTMFNASYSPNFEIAFISQNTIYIVLSCAFCVSELLIIAVLAHLACQLKVLQNSIRRIVPNAYKKMMKNKITDESDEKVDASKISWKHLQSVIQETVQHHLTIIDLAQETEGIFSISVMLILISAIVIIAGFLYRFELVHVLGIFCQLGEIGLICYWGNEVSLESRNVMDACYDVNFFGADVRFQKSLFLIMERSKRPIVFTAGRFSPLTLGTFLTITRAAYSFLLVLQRMT